MEKSLRKPSDNGMEKSFKKLSGSGIKQNFIKTSDIETRDKLIELGFQQINSSEPGVYTFLNSTNANFSNIDKKKIHYSNCLAV